jgi:alpha-1,2-mannosyltransferase
MKVLVLHPSVNIGGGAERVCVCIIESLKNRGHSVVLGTFDKPNWSKLEKNFGKVVIPDAEIIHKRRFGFSAYGELLNFNFLASKVPKDYDAIVVSCTSPWFCCPDSKRTVVYMLPPMGYQKGLKRLYLDPYIFLQHRSLAKVQNKVVLTNSKFSAVLIEELYSLTPQVLYPPVEVNNFFAANKEKLVVSVGRLHPFKRFELLIDSFAKVDEGRCIILGNALGSSSANSMKYAETLKKRIEKLNLQNKVELIINSPFETLRDVVSKASIYVHCAMNEHFGISVVEAMASGCVPIVHRSGGAYIDIVENDKYGFSFKDTDELSENINMLLKNNNLCHTYSIKAKMRSEIFSKANFMREIADVVESNSLK